MLNSDSHLVTLLYLDVAIPKAASKKIIDGVECDEFGAKDYRPQLQLRPDHEARPLWVVCFIIYDPTDAMIHYRLVLKRKHSPCVCYVTNLG